MTVKEETVYSVVVVEDEWRVGGTNKAVTRMY